MGLCRVGQGLGRGRRVVGAKPMEEIEPQIPIGDIECLGDALLGHVGVTGQTLDRTRCDGIGAKQRLATQQEQEDVEPLGISQIGKPEALAVALPAIGAIKTQFNEITDDNPAAAVHLGGVAERLLHRREPAVARTLLGVQIRARRLQLQDRAGEIHGRPEPAQTGIRRPIALHSPRAGLGLHVMRPVGADELAKAQQAVHHLAEKLALQGFFFPAQQTAVRRAGDPARGDRPLRVVRERRQLAQCVGKQTAVEQGFEIIGHAFVLL